MNELSSAELDRLFPFHIRFDGQGRLLGLGRSLRRALNGRPVPNSLGELVEVRRPRRFNPAELRPEHDTLALLALHDGPFALRGQISSLDRGRSFVFLGSPWLTDQEAMSASGLMASDFALHDPTADHLILLGTLQNSLNESRELAVELEARSGELRAERTLLDQILSQIPYGIYWKDRHGLYVGCNEQYARTMGLRSPAAISGLDDRDLPTGSGRNASSDADDREVIETGVPILHQQTTMTTPEGAVRHMSSSSIPLRDHEDRVTGMVGVVVDLTEQKALEAQLAQAGRLESIGRLAAGVAHEINTPIQFVGDNLSFLGDCFKQITMVLQQAEGVAAANGRQQAEGLDALAEALERADLEFLQEEIPQAIDQSLDGIDRVRRIVKSMKEFSHPSADHQAAVDLNRTIDSAVTVAGNELKYVADVATRFDPALPPVLCFPGEVNQVVLNLLVNAAHAIADSGDDRGTVTVSTAVVGDCAEIRVADTGTGIPEHIRDKVFDPFFTTKEVGRGTGQGLALAHNVIVSKHRGALFFETELGVGTTFVVRLPLGPISDGLGGSAQ